MLILSAASVTLLGTVGVLNLSGYFESMPSGKREDIAAPSRILASSLIRGGTAAPLAQTISAAVAIEKVAPRYAPGAKKLRVKATVELDAEVDAHGEVVSALAVSGPIALRPAATEALLKWRFRPARRNGSDVKSTARVSIVFDRR
jgi:hypothetical protein